MRNYIAEDNLNISLKDITVTGRDGRVSQLDQVYIRGSMIRFFIVPDMLQNAPMWVFISLLLRSISFTHLYIGRFKRVGPNAMRGRGIGTARGRATIMRGASFLLYFFEDKADQGYNFFSHLSVASVSFV